MPKPDLAPYAARVVAAVKSYVAKSEAAMAARLGALEARLQALPAPERGERGEAGPAGNEAAVDYERIGLAIKDVVAVAVGEIPKPQDGKDGPPGEQGEPGPAGKDADMDALAAMIEARVQAELAIQLASVQGKDGAPGRDGQPGAPGPAGRDGENGAAGKDGRDALDLEAFELAIGEDGRTITLSLKRGEVIVQRSVRIPAILYRGVWREGKHETGDVVTWGGSAWHCNMDTEDKPGQSPAWRLMVKEGRPGKDGGSPPVPRNDGPVKLK